MGASDTTPLGRGVGPSVVGQLLRDRSLRLATALAVAVAIPVAVLFYFQFRAIEDLGQSSAVVLRQLSQETANRLVKDVEDALKAPQIDVLLGITQQQEEPLDLPAIRKVFDAALDSEPFLTRLYVWSDETLAHRGEVLSYDRDHREFRTDAPEAALVLKRFRELAPLKRAISLFETTIDGRLSYFQAQLRFEFPARDRLTSFVAVRVDAEKLRTDFFPAFIESKMKAVEGPFGFPPITASVIDGNNRVVYPRHGRAQRQFVDERIFPLLFFDPELARYAAADGRFEKWRLRTGYGNQTISEIIDARARPQRALMAMLAGVLALGVFFVVRAAAREVKVAELRSNFVSGVSHDLKTPLALIQLFAETLELGRLKNTDRAHEYYRIINSEARKLTRLINNLLDFSKIEAGLRTYTKREPVNLSELTQGVLDALESQFAHNQFTVTSKLDARVPVLIDAEAVVQAIENLVSNAMKYSPERRDIEVEVTRAGGYGVVRVRDHGIGIPQRLQRKIFRKFFRIQTDAGSGPQGTGLGLAIVDHVMRGHGGFVRVDSEPGRGSAFTLHFPLYAGETHGDQTHTGDRGRASDVARSA
ncbi:MAG TPA: HAMP domain-containing sensor histidine kinase [Vicinamibacterales bacterium]|nr:HAMP domain-containing sensor histidine kinase [Vicinamibacterales bacterium]